MPIFGDTGISYLFDKYFQLQKALSPKPEVLNPVEERPWNLCIGSKSRARNDCIDLLPWSK